MVSSTGNFVSDSNTNDIKKIKKLVREIADNQIYQPSINDLSTIFANQGQRNAAHGVLTGTEVIQPITHYLTDTPIGGSPTGVFNRINLMSSNVVVDRQGFTALELKTIQGTGNNGQRIGALTVAVGKTLTLKPGDNLAISSDIAMTDQDVAYLVYSEDIGNKYRVIFSKNGGGTNLWSAIIIDVNKDMGQHALTNLSLIQFNNTDAKLRQIQATIGTGMIFDLGTIGSPTVSEGYFFKINGGQMLQISPTQIIASKDIVPQIGSLRLGGPASINQWLNIYTAQLTFDFANQVYINGNTTSMGFNVKTGGIYQFSINNIVVFQGDVNSWTVPQLFSSSGYINLSNWGIDPSSNGELVRNGTDIKVFSGGAVRNLSNVAVYANQTLSNLTNPTNVNQDLIPASSKNLGGVSNFWISSYVQNMVVGVAANSISKDGSNNMLFGVPTGKTFIFTINSLQKVTIDSSTFNAPNLDASFNSVQGLIFAQFANGGVDPFANGMFELNGTNMKVMSGGIVKDFTQMPQLNANNIWTLTNLFNATVFIKTQTFLILNQNDTQDTYLRQSTAPAVVPKKLDVVCFSDICFQGIGETSTSLSRGLVKGLQQSGDPTTVQIPSGYFTVNKNTSSGAVKIWYNDAGTLKSATLS